MFDWRDRSRHKINLSLTGGHGPMSQLFMSLMSRDNNQMLRISFSKVFVVQDFMTERHISILRNYSRTTNQDKKTNKQV